jgi:probable HAF family extracellular repeat protein
MACGENVVQLAGSPPPLPVTQAFRWTLGGGMQALGFLPGAGFYSSARGMSGDGSVIVGWAADAGNVNRPFRWTQATGMVDLSGGAFAGLARGVSGDGTWVVGSNSTTGRAFIWSAATGAVDLPALPGATSSAAAAVLYDGRVVGVSGGQACVWFQGQCFTGMQVARVIDSFSSDAIGWNLTVAQSGSWEFVAGYGANPSGQTQAWVGLVPPPSPVCCCGVDFNGDGDTGTDADIEAFFACLAGNCCPTCYALGADFDNDGDTGTDADIEAFFRALAGGCC